MTTKKPRKLILFQPNSGEEEKYCKHNGFDSWDVLYRVNHPDSPKSCTKFLEEHSDSSGKPLPEPGYRLTRSIKDSADLFTDSGWEVVRVSTYETDDPEADYPIIAICYCDYLPISNDEQWTKKAHRAKVSPDSFGGDKTKYREYMDSQKIEATV